MTVRCAKTHRTDGGRSDARVTDEPRRQGTQASAYELLRRLEEIAVLSPNGGEGRDEREQDGPDQDRSRQQENQGHGDYGDGHSPEIGSKRVPRSPTHHHPQWGADNDADQGDRRRLPPDGRPDLAVHEPDDLQEPDLTSTPVHAHHQQVEQGRRPEDGQHSPEEEWEVDRFAKVDQRGRRNGWGGHGLVVVEITVERCRSF